MDQAKVLEKFNAWLEDNRAKNPVRERNLRVIKRACTENADVREFREGFKRKWGIDPLDNEKLPFLKEGFQMGTFMKALPKKLHEAGFREADSSSAFTQFLRAGIQSITVGMYQTVKTSYEDWVTAVQSSKAEEPYAPMHGVSFPNQVGAQMPYPEVAAAALDLKLKNLKFGSIYSVEKELLEDDQTGEFQRQAGLLGEYLKILTEVWVYGKLASVSGASYAGLSIPTSETFPSYETAYPWAPPATPLRGGATTRPAAFGALSQANIQAGIIALMQQKNLQGLIMNVKPSRILISPFYAFDLAILLNSSYYPSGAAAAGQTGGAFAINPLKSIADSSVTPYMFNNSGVSGASSKAWYLIDDSKPWFVCQHRVPVAVEQENPQAGESFNRDIYRFKGYTRMNADFIDPRFAWQGSDGSV